MKGSELKEFVESILDDVVDETLFYTLLNVAKDNIEDDGTMWMILRDIDSSQSVSPSDTYLTLKSLPTSFRAPLGDIFIGGLNYKSIAINQREKYKTSSRKFYIDYASNKFSIIGVPNTTQKIYFPYLMTSEDIDKDSEWGFPVRFHKILGFMVAGYITAGVDADDIYFRMSPEHKTAAKLILENLRRWNNNLALHAMGNSAAEELDDDSDIGLL